MLVNTPALLKDLLTLLPDVLPSVSIDELKELPRSSACYLWTKEDVVLYVGLTGNMHFRWNNPRPMKLEQLCKRGATRVSWISLKQGRRFDEMDDEKILEAVLIQLYSPALNIEWHPGKKFLWADRKRPSKRLT
ncbi:GIY-YIG nuclease family protein [Scytonema millei]|uniref:GIY-YIG nuclease family protein n=1 Tax=Scytonema millei VB511283 TaxID=1245923 RepID=A0A9X5E416_9CYAN|nr:GIY-YIG nuclease family protein [Scytonema millei]NHC33799.1 GIY-YIG nuclease family protein [Scytonema millei VB511283]